MNATYLSARAVVVASSELYGSTAPVARAIARVDVAEIHPSAVEALEVRVGAEFRHELELAALVSDLRQVGGLTRARIDFSGVHR